jgi:SAM-dependent methyltransferase
LNARLRGGRLLEIGGGDGTVARGLVAAGAQFKEYTMADLVEKRVQAAAKSIDDLRFVAVACNIEDDQSLLHRDYYDVAILVALIEHLVDPIGAMKRVRDALRPGGFAYVDTPNVAKFTRRAKLLFGKFPSTASVSEGLKTYDGRRVDLFDGGHLHYWTFQSMSRMLVDYCGFSRIERAPYWPTVQKKARVARHYLAKSWPEMFSDVAVIAYK